VRPAGIARHRDFFPIVDYAENDQPRGVMLRTVSDKPPLGAINNIGDSSRKFTRSGPNEPIEPLDTAIWVVIRRIFQGE
jgi:hypothetical protein